MNAIVVKNAIWPETSTVEVASVHKSIQEAIKSVYDKTKAIELIGRGKDPVPGDILGLYYEGNHKYAVRQK